MTLDRKAAVSKIHRDRRIDASRKKRFDPSISTPGAFPFTMPEAGILGVSSSVAVSQGALIVSTSTGRSIGTANLAPNQIHRLGFFEKGVEIDISASPVGNITLHYLDNRREASAIATGTF